MKKVIDGKLCNTETAKLLGEYCNQSFSENNSDRICERLYRTKSGTYFLHGQGGDGTKYKFLNGEKIIIVSEKDAKKWAEKNLTADEYMAAFEITDDERVYVGFSLESTIVDKVDALGAEWKTNRADTIRKMIMGALKENGKL